ncbi:glycosyltransferase family 4 protein [Candidatus Microgenomates bacterium]|nr:glycosyltransferase family 4 protein [Candidatus Microgenomates bacterium]
MKKLKIAQLILPWIALPPKGYGGTERIVTWLTEGLVKKGHEVTLFASGDSTTSAKLSSVVDKALTLQTDVHSTISANLYPLCHTASCFAKAEEFDIIHSHAQYLALPFSNLVKTPTVHTFHRKLKGLPDEEFLVKYFKNEKFISISNNQREFGLNFVATVYNGIPFDDFEFSDQRGDYLFWAGRAVDKKGPLEAIKAAKATGIPLKMAGIPTESDFYKEKIKTEVDGELITWMGEQDHQGMVNLYKNALLSLFPIKWREPYGLIPVESMACGTPAVSFACGGAAETVVDGKVGFLVDPEDEDLEPKAHVKGLDLKIKKRGVDGLVEAVQEIAKLENSEMIKLRKNCRRHVEENFSVKKMVEDYERVYQTILNKS